MKISVIAFSKSGAVLAGKIISGLSNSETEIEGFLAQRHNMPGFEPFSSVFTLTARLFNKTDALVFIGACGIAVRAIAPCVKSKMSDPAVVVCDETGLYAISLLSGHLGGANELARRIAKTTGGQAVITTASDIHTAGKPLPKNLVLGIGCRKGVSAQTIERAATILLWDEKIPLSRVCAVATIDIKRGEQGLLDFANAHKLKLYFYSARELSETEGEFTPSERVLKAVGVDNVCERAAVLCGIGFGKKAQPPVEKGKLIVKKKAKDGVTVAVYETNGLLSKVPVINEAACSARV
ncbi:MAG: cobalamin biosynthesis protein [Clostridiales bacterium]|jgi:cobalt-precorrin 5A hydrolase|nr:cobalamin biosynthesis protein [Clostridiales bacterium]